MKVITIIVPCYNEQESLYLFYDEIVKYMVNPNYHFELLFINDGSKDTWIESKYLLWMMVVRIIP